MVTAPATMPSEEDVARVIAPYAWEHIDADRVSSQPLGETWERSVAEKSLKTARAILDLFAPILAEKERRDALDREQAETVRFLQHHLDNPQPPSEALKKLFADYQAAGVQSVGLDSPLNACCYRDACRALEVRALAAEAALAAERERCAKIAYHWIIAQPEYGTFSAEYCDGYSDGSDATQAAIAAAIRAQGE